jgi:D-alanine-D-alanine ligase
MIMTSSMAPEEMKKKRIGVLMGGRSAEREVSLASGKNILEALFELGYNTLPVEADENLAQYLVSEKIQVAFIGLHGRLGEDGAVQGLLEVMRIPYTGSGILASALSMNKVVSRQIFVQSGLPVPRYIVLQREKGVMTAEKIPIPLPVVVKPSQEGSSVGVSIILDQGQLPAAMEKAFEYDEEILVEEYIQGREISVGILGDEALAAIEIIPKVQFYNYEAKYSEGLAEHICPAPLPRIDYERALAIGLEAHRLLQCEGGTRVDFLYREKPGAEGQFFLLEVKSLPGMTRLSLLPEIARAKGISFSQLVERILLGARLKIPVRPGRDSSETQRA